MARPAENTHLLIDIRKIEISTSSYFYSLVQQNCKLRDKVTATMFKKMKLVKDSINHSKIKYLTDLMDLFLSVETLEAV